MADQNTQDKGLMTYPEGYMKVLEALTFVDGGNTDNWIDFSGANQADVIDDPRLAARKKVLNKTIDFILN